MNIDVRNYLEYNDKENSPLVKEDYFKFEMVQEQICKIQNEGNREQQCSGIEADEFLEMFCFSDTILLTPEQQEKLKPLQEQLGNIEKYLQKFVELNWKVTSYKNENTGEKQSIKEHRQELLKQFLTNPENKKYLEEFSRLHEKITIYLGQEQQQKIRTNTDIENYLTQKLDNFLDYDEEMIEILIQKKDEILNQMIEVNPELQEQYEKNNEIYQKILQSKKEYQNKADGISKAWLHFYEGLEKDYLESIYTGNTKVLGIDWSTLQNLEVGVNNLKENFSLGELFNIIFAFPNQLRGYSWRGARLFGDILKSIINENIYDIGVEKGKHKTGKWEANARQFLQPGDPWYEQTLGYPYLILPATVGGGLNATVDLAVGITIFTLGPDQAIKDLKKLGVIFNDVLKKGIGEYGKEYLNYWTQDKPEAFGDTIFVGSYIATLLAIGGTFRIPFVPQIPENIPNIFSVSAGLTVRGIGEVSSISRRLTLRRQAKEFSIHMSKVKELESKLDELGEINKSIVVKESELEKLGIYGVERRSILEEEISLLQEKRITFQDEIKTLNEVIESGKKETSIQEHIVVKKQKEINEVLEKVKGYNEKGVEYYYQGKSLDALEEFAKALKIQMKEAPDTENMATIFFNIGQVYKVLGDDAQHIEMMETALQIRFGLKNKSQNMSYTHIGRVYGGLIEKDMDVRGRITELSQEISRIANRIGRKTQQTIEKTDDISNMLQKSSNFTRMLYISSLNLENFLTGKYEKSEVKEIMEEVGKSARYVISEEFQKLSENEKLDIDEINQKILDQIVANKDKLRYDIDIGQVEKALSGKRLPKDFEGEQELASVIDNSSKLFTERLGVLEITRKAESDVDRLILKFIELKEEKFEKIPRQKNNF